MPDPIITNNTTSGIVLWEPVYEDEVITSAGAATWLEGTLLGRITASGKMTAYESGNVDGSEVPTMVLTEEVVFAGAGDKPCRPLVTGRVRRAKLVAFAVGAITVAEADLLRDFGIVSLTTNQLAEQDNQ